MRGSSHCLMKQKFCPAMVPQRLSAKSAAATRSCKLAKQIERRYNLFLLIGKQRLVQESIKDDSL
jgi:hypothetical protein